MSIFLIKLFIIYKLNYFIEMEGFEFVGGDNSGPQFAQQEFGAMPMNGMDTNGFGQPFDGGMQMNFQNSGSQMNQ